MCQWFSITDMKASQTFTSVGLDVGKTAEDFRVERIQATMVPATWIQEVEATTQALKLLSISDINEDVQGVQHRMVNKDTEERARAVAGRNESEVKEANGRTMKRENHGNDCSPDSIWGPTRLERYVWEDPNGVGDHGGVSIGEVKVESVFGKTIDAMGHRRVCILHLPGVWARCKP